MAAIETPRDWDSARAIVLAMDAPGLIAQHLVQRGAAHALETLLERGVTREAVVDMLEGTLTMKGFIQATAAMRGVKIVSEE